MWQPFGTAPYAEPATHWKSGPNERGTFSILSTCVLTLILGAYTSLHFNIPEHGKSTWSRQFWRFMLWIVIALAAPEVVAYAAFRQWFHARNIERQMTEILGPLLPGSGKISASDAQVGDSDIENGSQISTGPSIRTNSWTRTHSHFAIMGGFAFDTSKSPINFLPGGRTRLTLTPYALRKLAADEPEIIPDLSASAIQDKSKSNGFAKFLVCMQACWFIAQTIGRLAASFPISLLEMNTLLHAVCCLLVYFAWWNKPYDIAEPVLIETSTDHLRQICAWMAMNSQSGINRDRWQNTGAFKEESRLSKILHNTNRTLGHFVYNNDMHRDSISAADNKLYTNLERMKDHNRSLGRPEEVYVDDITVQESSCMKEEQGLIKLFPGQTILGFTLVLYTAWDLDNERDAHLTLSPGDLECLQLAKALRTSSSTENTWQFEWNITKTASDSMLVPRISVFSPTDPALDNFIGSTWLTHKFKEAPSLLFICGLLLAGSVYGLVHLLAWDTPFPTPSERWVWLISCFVIASPFFLLIVTLLGLMVLYGLKLLCQSRPVLWLLYPFKFLYPVVARSFILFTLCSSPSMLLVLVVYFLAYTFGRVYLLVECFINLAHLPPAVYLEPDWSRFIPHFTSG